MADTRPEKFRCGVLKKITGAFGATVDSSEPRAPASASNSFDGCALSSALMRSSADDEVMMLLRLPILRATRLVSSAQSVCVWCECANAI
jgi:hypothetical protein